MKGFCTAVVLAGAMAAVAVAATPEGAAPASGGVQGKNGAALGHAKPLPTFVEKREKERIAAADLVARGVATPDANGLVQLKNGKSVRYRLQGTENLTAVLVDFTDVKHGQIAQPDRTVDNSTYWSADVSPKHYSDMLF